MAAAVELVRKFAAKIGAALPNVKQIFCDERLSTVAAVYILQDRLDGN